MRYKILFLAFLYCSAIPESFSFVKHARDIAYSDANDRSNLLDVYYNKSGAPRDVIVFIHGGSWNSGSKETYWWLGRNFVRKDMVAVIINYSLSPFQYDQMANDCAAALKWVKLNIANYNGNPNRIFVMGHSAGAHLAELINLDPHYFKQEEIVNPIHGVILNDPFGLDMYDYMTKAEKDDYYASFLKTFSSDARTWKTASPLNYISNATNPHLIFRGGRTYPAIKIQSQTLYDKLTAANKTALLYVIKHKKHVPMITQMLFGGNRLYGLIDYFRENN